ncbi:MAG: tetratricopeptide repeat protein, partial [Deltaproteobacteria bacterium]
LWVHLYDAHFPYAPPPDYAQRFAQHPYDGELAYVDDQLDRLERALDAAGRRPLWVIAGDHGESLGEHREITHGLFVYDSTQHVPLIIAGPGVEPQVVDQPVSQVDILPTVLSLAGRPVPDDIDGRVQPGHPHPLWMESFQLVEQFGYAPHLGIVDGDYKLIDKPRPELYRLTDDPGERHDLAADQPEQVARLQAARAALDPRMPAHRTEALDPDALARLQALGYVTASTFDVDFAHLPDPADKREVIAKVLRADAIGHSDPDRAVALMREAVALEPDQPRMQIRLARLMRASGRAAEADAVLEAAVDRFPDDPEVMLHAATAKGLGGDDAASLALGRRALELDPDNARAAELVAGALLNLGRREELVAFAEERLATHPDETGLRALQGIALFDLGRLSEAEKALRLAARSSRPRPGVCQRLASLALAAGVLDDAERWLLREAELHGMSLRTRTMLIDVWSRRHDRAKVLAHADVVLAQQPDAAKVWLAKVIALFDEGRIDEAAAAVRQALQHLPDDPDLLLMQANILHKQGHTEEALAVKARADAAHQARIEAMQRAAGSRAQPPRP